MVARAKLMLLVLSEYIGTFSTFNTFETLVLVLLWYFWNSLVLLKYFGGTHMFLCEANGREPSWWRPEMNSQFGSWEEAAGRGREGGGGAAGGGANKKSISPTNPQLGCINSSKSRIFFNNSPV